MGTKILEHYESQGDIVWRVNTEEKVIALTFDDGPDPDSTLTILDLLSAYKAKSTFFVIGKRANSHPHVLSTIYNQGHEIANHTYNHIDMKNHNLSIHELEDEILKTEQVIYNTTGHYPRLFRPPGGNSYIKAVKFIVDKGYKIILWSNNQDSEDWQRPDVEVIVNRILNNACAGNIVLFHDRGNGVDQTIEALNHILPELMNRGFRFVTVSELLELEKTEKAQS